VPGEGATIGRHHERERSNIVWAVVEAPGWLHDDCRMPSDSQVLGRELIVAGLSALLGCGGPPMRPSTSPTTLPAPTARDGWTEQPVTATFTINNGTVTATAPGYLPRVARFFGDPLYLWPQEEAYVRALVYGNTPAVLYRWTKPTVTVQSPPDLARPATSALVELHESTGVSFSFVDAGDVALRLDPDDPYFSDKPTVTAYTQIRSSGGAILSVLVVFRNAQAVDLATLHEFGHAMGLTHSPRIDDVMWATTERTAYSFSDRERIALRLMYRWSAPGNLPPDREAGVSSATVRTIVVLD
jgi:Matrixin